MESLKSKKFKRMRNAVVLFLFVSVLVSSLGSSISVQAASYPSFYPQRYYTYAQAGDKVTFGYTIYPAYQNERIHINIYDSAGKVVAGTTKDFRHVYDTPFTYTVSWDTDGEMPGKYTVVAEMEFYTYLSWHDCPTSPEKTYIILETNAPKKQTVKSLKVQNGRKLKVTWKKDTQADGYLIEYSTDRKFKKGKKSITIGKNKTTKKTITKLKKGKQYYVRVCSYKNTMEDGQIQKLCGAWSKAKRSTAIK